jgi:chromosome partitioning protein
MKGGVGKTTLAVNIGWALASEHGNRVLIVDADPQFNASSYLMTDDQYLKHTQNQSKHTILDIFMPKRHDSISTVKGKKKASKKGIPTLDSCAFRVFDSDEGHLDVVPSTLALMEIEMSQRGTENRLRNFLRDKKDAYDYVLIDCPPTISIFSQAALLASDKYIVPMKPDPLSSTGLPLLERWLDETTEAAGIEVEQIGIVFSLVRSPLPNTMFKVMRELRESRGESVFEEHLTQSTEVATSVEKHKPIFRYKPDSPRAAEVLAITQEFLERVEG